MIEILVQLTNNNHTSSMEYAALLGATGSPILASSSANNCLSSVRMIELTGVPNTRTPYWSNTPVIQTVYSL